MFTISIDSGQKYYFQAMIERYEPQFKTDTAPLKDRSL